MPELAEVALFARDLNKISKGQSLTKVSFSNRKNWGDVIIPAETKRRIKCLESKDLVFVSQGKALLLFSTTSIDPIVEFRLAMSGQFHSGERPNFKPHYFIRMRFGDQLVAYADPRRFGRVHLPRPESIYALGGFTPELGLKFVKRIKVPPGFLDLPKITWLLRTGEHTGVGNYMANEALGRLNISPFSPCDSESQAREILRECQTVAKESFSFDGNSFATKFCLLDGSEGRYRQRCSFYQKIGVPKIMYNNRPVFTFFQPPTI